MKRLLPFLFMLLSPLAHANGETISPNMSLVVPAVGVTTGPQWAADIDMSLGIIDRHDHSPGNGVQITPDGMNISGDLTFQGHSLTFGKSVQFSSNVSPLSSVGSIYEAGVDLYYTDGNGNQIRLTQSGSVVGAPGTISGVVPPASASYVSGSSTFIFQSAVNTSANIDGACLIQRDIVAGSNAVTVCPPAGLGANYTVTWPGTLPVSQRIFLIDSSGNLQTTMTSAAADPVGQNMTSTGADPIGVAMTSVGANAVANSRTRAVSQTVGVGGVAVSPDCGQTINTSVAPVANLSVTITTTGRPVFIGLIDTWASVGTNFSTITSSQNANIRIQFFQGSTQLTNTALLNTAGQSTNFPASAVSHIDFPAAGTYTYTIQAGPTNGGNSLEFSHISMVAYEL